MNNHQYINSHVNIDEYSIYKFVREKKSIYRFGKILDLRLGSICCTEPPRKQRNHQRFYFFISIFFVHFGRVYTFHRTAAQIENWLEIARDF